MSHLPPSSNPSDCVSADRAPRRGVSATVTDLFANPSGTNPPDADEKLLAGGIASTHKPGQHNDIQMVS